MIETEPGNHNIHSKGLHSEEQELTAVNIVENAKTKATIKSRERKVFCCVKVLLIQCKTY